jgi:aspartyl-tRNA(Asn)/glutamyl-tRNA(Gln) amidotransferase subunit C
MKISIDEARRVAELAALEFGEADLERAARELSRILDYVEQLEAVDVSRVPVAGAESGRPNRADELESPNIAEEIEGNAPAMIHGHFVVPRVIGGE